MFPEAWRPGLVLPVLRLHTSAPALAHVHIRDPAPPAGARKLHVHHLISIPRSCSVASPPFTSPPASSGCTTNTFSTAPRSYSLQHHNSCQIPETTTTSGGSGAGGRGTAHSRNTSNGHEKGKYCLTSDEVVKSLFYNCTDQKL